MKTIKAGQTMTARSVCDLNAVFTLKVISRTKKIATIDLLGNVQKCKIGIDYEGNEFLRPVNYSMAPIFRA